MASGAIISWQIGGETMETVTDFIFLGSKITADGDNSYEIKVGLCHERILYDHLGWLCPYQDCEAGCERLLANLQWRALRNRSSRFRAMERRFECAVLNGPLFLVPGAEWSGQGDADGLHLHSRNQ